MYQLYIKWCREQQAENTKKYVSRQLRVGFLIGRMTDSIDCNVACMGNQRRNEGSLSMVWWWVQRSPIRGLAWFRRLIVTDGILGITLTTEEATGAG
ncbi:hypothetical protein MUK42_28867 [Musa troglodytarum]|uniref:Uncharacterized protein n=1 Tax=Musa troglodytarum TaxID=320322 RepID=A0A9E7JVK4_9LILI|nr:hypothetical protein MUK42_28867 [Musa troglodytarum]